MERSVSGTGTGGGSISERPPDMLRRGEARGEARRGEGRGEGGRSGEAGTPCRGEAGT